LEAQQKAIRALAYNDRLAPYAIAENQIAHLGSPKLAILPSPQALTDAAWNSLMGYVNGGGTLLITGPVDHDEHWRVTSRAAELKVSMATEPLTYHNAALLAGERTIPLSFDQQKQNSLEALRFSDGSTLKEIPLGKGRVFWAAFPVELAEGTQAAADLYQYVASRAGIAPIFDVPGSLSPGVLIYPTVFDDSILYTIISDNADDSSVDLRDKLTGLHAALRLPSQHAAMVLIGKQEKKVIAKYGF
jgi:hypothetical protein